MIADYNNFFEVVYLTSTTTTAVSQKLRAQFSRNGIPDIVFLDNGPQSAHAEFREFSKDWEFEHETSSPRYPQANGKVENAIKTCKMLIKKAALSKTDIYLALLTFRNTPSEGVIVSPAQRLFSRRTKTGLPTTAELLMLQVIPCERVTAGLEQVKEKQRRNYNTNAHVLPPLNSVHMRLPGEEQWSLATCTRKAGLQPYDVLCGNREYRRNRLQLRSTSERNMSAGEQALSETTLPEQVAQLQLESSKGLTNTPLMFERSIGPPMVSSETDQLQIGRPNN